MTILNSPVPPANGVASQPENINLNVSPAPIVSLRNVTKVFGAGETQVVALNDVNLDIYPGQFTTIMGPSGSGKSTLLYSLAGLDFINYGAVYINGQVLSQLNDYHLTCFRREHIGFVFQAFNLVSTLTAEENILLPLRLAGSTPDQAWISQVIDTLDIRTRLHHKPHELSGGQQQRVAVARALASRPDIIVADEPTGNLDSNSSAEVLTMLKRAVQEFKQTVIMVTHDPKAALYGDRTLVVRDGAIVADLFNPTADQIAKVL